MSRRRIATLFLSLALIGSERSALAEGDPNSAALPQVMTGTVAEVAVDARQVRVLTGVGHAARIMAFHAGTECRVTDAGAHARLSDVTRGAIVVVRFRKSGATYEAESIDVRPQEPEGNGP